MHDPIKLISGLGIVTGGVGMGISPCVIANNIHDKNALAILALMDTALILTTISSSVLFVDRVKEDRKFNNIEK